MAQVDIIGMRLIEYCRPYLEHNVVIMDMIDADLEITFTNDNDPTTDRIIAYALYILYNNEVTYLDLESICGCLAILIKRSSNYIFGMWHNGQLPLNFEEQYIVPLIAKLTMVNYDVVLFFTWCISRLEARHLEFLTKFTEGNTPLNTMFTSEELRSCRRLLKQQSNVYIHILLHACQEFKKWNNFIISFEALDIPSPSDIIEMTTSSWFIVMSLIPIRPAPILYF